MSIRVILADDHRIVREGLKGLLKKLPNIEVIAEAENGRNTVKLAQKMAPDVVVMDVAMPDMNGIEATRQIITSVPATKIIALSMHSDRRFIAEMLSAGASGYLVKDCASEELADAICTVAAGRSYLSPSIVDVVVKTYGRIPDKPGVSLITSLSPREREVLQLIAEGKTVKDIACRLCVSVKTVETYRQHIMDKLDTRSIAELTKFAIREGITHLDL